MPNRLIVDAHLDLGWNALQWNRDLTQSVQAIRDHERGLSGKGRGEGTVALPELALAGIGVAFVTTLARCTGHPVDHLDYRHPAQAFAAARGQLAYYQALAQLGHGRILKTPCDLDDFLTAWQAWQLDDSLAYPGLGMVLCMESADPILTPDALPDWCNLGVRMIGPAHYGEGRYVGGTGSTSGFKAQGFELLRGMAAAGLILDVTHLSDRAFQEASDHYPGPIAASHHNCRTLVEHQRQLSDAQIASLAKRGGVIGTALDAWMLVPGWVKGQSSHRNLFLKQIIRHIDHICQITGTCDNVGIGSDLDGGFGKSQAPSDLDTIADLSQLADLLAAAGYNDPQVDAILHGNWLRLLKTNPTQSLPAQMPPS